MINLLKETGRGKMRVAWQVRQVADRHGGNVCLLHQGKPLFRRSCQCNLGHHIVYRADVAAAGIHIGHPGMFDHVVPINHLEEPGPLYVGVG